MTIDSCVANEPERPTEARYSAGIGLNSGFIHRAAINRANSRVVKLR